MKDGLYSFAEVTEILGVTSLTLDSWLRYKHENPDEELAKLLPEPKRIGPRNARFWSADEVDRIKEFQVKLPRGRRGVLNTNRYKKETRE